MALADDIFGSGTPTGFNLDTPFTQGRVGSAAPLRQTLQESILRLQETDPLFRSLSDLLQGGVVGSRDILGTEFGRASAFGNLVTPQTLAQEDQAALERSQLLRGQNQDTLGRLLQAAQAGPSLSPEDQARIQQAADLAVQSGLSDLSRNREQIFQDIRQSAASRGLRPSDSPIVQQLANLGEQFGRQAQGLTTDIRTQQLLQELQYPLAAFQANLGGLATASQAGAQERAFEQNLVNQAQATRLGLTSGAISGAGNLATGQDPSTILTRLRPPVPPPSQDAPLDIGGILSGAGGLASGIGAAIAFSDERVKEDIEPLDAKSVLDRIRGVRYRYKDSRYGGDGDQMGILAQDLIAAGLGSAVIENDEGTLMVDTRKVALPTLGLLASLNARVSELEARDA